MARRGRAARVDDQDQAPEAAPSESVPVARLGMSRGLARLVRFGLGAWALIGILILCYWAGRYVLAPIGIIFPPLILALVFVYFLNPVVSALERRGLRRGWATLLTYLVILTVIGVAIRYLVPLVAGQVTGFAKAVPGLLDNLQKNADTLNDRFNLNLDVKQAVQSFSPTGGGGKFISRLFSFTVGVLHGVVVFVIGLLVSFYLVVDLPKIRRAAMAAVPPRHAAEVRRVGSDISHAVGAYFSGQLLVATFVGIASGLVLWIVGLPYWALVGGVAGITNLIPLIGPFIGAAVAIFIAFTTTAGATGGLLHLDPGLPLALGSGIGLLLVQQIDNHIITPNVIGRTVSLHPVTVMLGLLAAGSVFGLPGMLLAVPVAGSVKVVMLHWWDKRRWPPPGPTDAGGGGGPGERTVLKDASTKSTVGEVPA
ncbi:MAG TPA: AI-2E family transporter [Actinomycetota bacterium]|nr:AI-2E family transporter [Actinomycetota bacterium]